MGNRYYRHKIKGMKYCTLACKDAKSDTIDNSKGCRTFDTLYCRKNHQVTLKGGLCLNNKLNILKNDRER